MNNHFLFSIVMLWALSHVSPVEAIGGRGGGGGGHFSGGGGGHFGGGRSFEGHSQFEGRGGEGEHSFHDNPSAAFSMSRADERPSYGAGSHYSQSFNAEVHPSQGQLQQFLGPSTQQSASHPLSQLSQSNTQQARHTSSQFATQHPNASNWFKSDFNNQHGYNPGYYNHNFNGWGAAGWAATAGWLGLAASDAGGYPAYYYDESGYSTLSPDDASSYAPPSQNVYINNGTTGNVAAAGQGQQPQGDWLPLGVFALGSTAEQAPYSNMVIQLAVNKNGELAGTYYNAATDQTKPIEGMVDKKTQKAAWKLSNQPDSPIASTGIYNLTQDTATIQVHFPDGTDQSKVLVRINSYNSSH